MTRFRVAGRGVMASGKPLTFRFDDRTLSGNEGDTLASALLANGVHLVGRSFKYHRPRGILAAGSEEPNALVTLDRGEGRSDPNLLATCVELYDGLVARSQNAWPSIRTDVGAINDWLHPLFAAGFYYKTFMWPRSFWHRVYEPLIRSAAGLGKAPKSVDPDRYVSRYAHCDVLVVGSGPAGLSAALAAGTRGAKVVLADEQARLGGSLLAERTLSIDGRTAERWLDETTADLAATPNVRLLPRTTAFGFYHQNFVGLCERLKDHLGQTPDDQPRQRLWRIRAKQVILAPGAIERPLVFPGNDRPGILLADAARVYLNRYGVLVGRKIVVATSHDSAWRTAIELSDAGADVAAIADYRASVPPDLIAAARQRGIAVYPKAKVVSTAGRSRIRSVQLEDAGSKPVRLSCDALLMSGGWTPTVHLHSQAGGKLLWNEGLGAFIPTQASDQWSVVGAGAGNFGWAEALRQGHAAGVAASSAGGAGAASSHDVSEGSWSGEAQADVAPRGRAFVDFQNDVTAKDIRGAIREGFQSVEHLKRYTTTGMATDQGKTSNLNAIGIGARAMKRSAQEVGTTTFRPPYTPVTFGALAGFARGSTFEPVRKTPIDPWAEAHGAVFEPVSLWRRARYFPQGGESMTEAVARECRAVRNAVGMFDASPLGKIEVVGPDAAEFLNRVYINSWTKLAPGRCRYGILLGEDGFIRDDGIVARLAEDRFHVTTTTGGAARVLSTMEDYRQTEWPDLKVWLTSTTEQWAVIAVNGPNAKRLIEPFIRGIDLGDEVLPHMGYAEGLFETIPLRLFRLSFTGERGYELNVPSVHARQVWETLVAAGEGLGLAVYGTEAMHVLRAEKGFIIVGQDTDGTVTPEDAGLSWAIGKAKPDFIGKRSLARPDLLKPDRPQLVGLRSVDSRTVLEEGAQVMGADGVGRDALGHVTSAYFSATLGHPIALALVSGGRKRLGEQVRVTTRHGKHLLAEITGTVFYDAAGGRLGAVSA